MRGLQATVLLLLTPVALAAPSAVVVGGGVGGLFVAAKLAKSGVDVTLVEKNGRDAAGGRLACETVVADNGRRYRFETGPSLLLLPSVYREALASLGLDPNEHLRLARCAPSYGVHFADGLPSPLEIGGNAASEATLRENMESVEPGSYTAYQDYLAAARANLDAGLPIFIRERLGTPELAKLPKFLGAALLGGGAASGRFAPVRDWPLASHAAQAEELFSVPRHRELATFQDLYIGLAPSDAPSVFSLLQAIELAPTGDLESDSGVFYPLNGWGTVRDALLAACEDSGVTCHWNTKVEEVLISEDDQDDGSGVRGVRVAPSPPPSHGDASFVHDPADEFARRGEPPSSAPDAPSPDAPSILMADSVIINADVATAEASLLPARLRRSAYRERSEVDRGVPAADSSDADVRESLVRAGGWRYSSSTVSFYFCLDRRYETLRHHNVFLGPSRAWEGLFDATEYATWDERLANGPLHFYVHAPARTDPTVVDLPSDDAIMVLVPVPPLPEGLSTQAVEAATERIVTCARAAVISTFEVAGMDEFGEAIVDERVRTPPGWRDAYGLRRGSVFGLSHPLEQLRCALSRPQHKPRMHPRLQF